MSWDASGARVAAEAASLAFSSSSPLHNPQLPATLPPSLSAAAAYDAAFSAHAPTQASLLASSSRLRALVGDVFDAMRSSSHSALVEAESDADRRARASAALRKDVSALAAQLNALRAQEALAAVVVGHGAQIRTGDDNKIGTQSSLDAARASLRRLVDATAAVDITGGGN